MSSTHAAARRARRGILPIAAVSVLVLVAAIAGLLLGGSLGGSDTPAVHPATAPRPIAQDGLRVQLPSGWARGNVTSVAGFVRPLRLHNGDDRLRASVERLPATSATLLPAAFLQTLKVAPDPPEVATLAGGRHAWRYRFPGQDGSMTLIYAAPTTSGVATVACTSPIDTSVPRACEALAAAATVPGSRSLAPSASAAFFIRLPAAVSDLGAARSKGIGELGAAKRATGQALAADSLARAHKAAGAALAPLTTAGDGWPSATVGALTATASAYTALATAARARSPKPYADARREVTGADADLRQTMTKVTAAVSAATRARPQVPSTPAAPTTPAATRPAAAKPADTKPAPVKPTASKPATTKPATTSKPATSKPATTTAVSSKPAASKPAAAITLPDKPKPAAASRGFDFTLLILALLGVIALCLAIREVRRAWLSAAEAQ